VRTGTCPYAPFLPPADPRAHRVAVEHHLRTAPSAVPSSRRIPAMTTPPAPRKLGPLGAYRAKLGNETFAGMILLAGALIALIWANSPWREAYQSLSDITF